ALVVRRSESSDHHSLSKLCTSQFRPANLAGAGLWQLREELDFSRILVRSKLAPHEILELFLEVVRRAIHFVENDKGLGYHPVQLIRRCNNGSLRDCRMLKKYSFDLRGCDLEPSANNDVVHSALILEETFTVADVNVARYIPSLPHIFLLLIRQAYVAAAGGPLHGKQAGLAVAQGFETLFIDDHRLIPRNHLTCCAGT